MCAIRAPHGMRRAVASSQETRYLMLLLLLILTATAQSHGSYKSMCMPAPEEERVRYTQVSFICLCKAAQRYGPELRGGQFNWYRNLNLIGIRILMYKM